MHVFDARYHIVIPVNVKCYSILCYRDLSWICRRVENTIYHKKEISTTRRAIDYARSVRTILVELLLQSVNKDLRRFKCCIPFSGQAGTSGGIKVRLPELPCKQIVRITITV